jgi:hypothetical protein
MKRTAIAALALSCALALPCAAAPAFPAGYLVSTGKAYTLNFEPKAEYPDKGGAMLTDGNADFAWGSMVSVNRPNPRDQGEIVIDLGEVRDDISFVGVQAMLSKASGVRLPAAIVVSVSEDDELYTVAGSSTAIVGDSKEDSVVTMGFVPAEPLSGEFVRIAVVCDDPAAWVLLAEALVGAGKAPDGLAPAAAKSFSAYDDVALGRPYTLTPAPAEAYPDSDGKEATDGKAAYSWADMIGFNNPKEAPTLVIDLGAPRRVDAVRCSFMRSQASAVPAPASFTVYVADATGAFRVAGVATVYDPPLQDEKVNALLWRNDTGADILASRVKIEIAPKGTAWTMLAEAEVLSGK